MPDLGQYASSVLGAYAVAIVLLVGLTFLSIRRAAKIKKQLSDLEKRRKKNG